MKVESAARLSVMESRRACAATEGLSPEPPRSEVQPAATQAIAMNATSARGRRQNAPDVF